MAFFTKATTLHRMLYRYHRPVPPIPPQSLSDNTTNQFTHSNNLFSFWLSSTRNRRLSANAKTVSSEPEFAGPNAYDLLGVTQSSSFEEIKASFRKLAKETHPDLARSHADDASKKFIQILAAYEILSDSEKRAHYDRYLLSQRAFIGRQCKRDPIMYKYESYRDPDKQMEVVEWLKWYRYAINDIVSERRVAAGSGSGYLDILERDFYSAIHAAYYGPEIECINLLPDQFEAEERSMHETSEVLHLVSGRDLFGMVCLANKLPEISHAYHEKLTSFASVMCQTVDNISKQAHSGATDYRFSKKQSIDADYTSDAYRDLELHVSGRVIAVATRIQPSYGEMLDEDPEDQIHVYLVLDEDLMHGSQVFPRDNIIDSSGGSRIHLGKITGLGTSSEEGTCDVYDSNGMKTHVIMKHRTLLVKHLHWYKVGAEVSLCECRCSRARLPPSKFWLFEPRSAMHDIGGWYIETFGKDKKGKTILDRRHWDGLDTYGQFDKRLHPAMYLLALAYRTLDIETARSKRKKLKDRVEAEVSRVLSWCKKLV